MKIDLLQFIPKTISGFEVFVEKEFVDNEEWLKIWYKQNRVIPIRIKRFVDAKSFGAMLGQYQAEGTKDAKKKFRFEFCNKSLLEHKEFISHLLELGLRKDKIVAQMSLKDGYDGTEISKEFEKITDIKVRYETKSGQKGKYGFRTYIRSTILTAVLLNALDKIRKHLSEEYWTETDTEVVNSFFAKLLTGDGTLDIRTKNREYDFPHIRVKLVDRKIEYLRDYSNIMKKLGFIPHIKEKYIYVRSGCSLENLLYLYRIRAFENGANWPKLLLAIGMFMNGRRHKTNFRFSELKKKGNFTSLDLMRDYDFGLKTVNDWLNNKEKEGLLIGIRKRPYSVQWKLTEKAVELSDTLEMWKSELGPLLAKNQNKGLSEILESLKVKGKPLAKESAQTVPSLTE